jgi:hypothetical protein
MDLKYTIKAEADLRAIDQTAKATERLGRETEKTARQLKEQGAQLQETGRKAEGFGDKIGRKVFGSLVSFAVVSRVVGTIKTILAPAFASAADGARRLGESLGNLLAKTPLVSSTTAALGTELKSLAGVFDAMVTQNDKVVVSLDKTIRRMNDLKDLQIALKAERDADANAQKQRVADEEEQLKLSDEQLRGELELLDAKKEVAIAEIDASGKSDVEKAKARRGVETSFESQRQAAVSGGRGRATAALLAANEADLHAIGVSRKQQKRPEDITALVRAANEAQAAHLSTKEKAGQARADVINAETRFEELSGLRGKRPEEWKELRLLEGQLPALRRRAGGLEQQHLQSANALQTAQGALPPGVSTFEDAEQFAAGQAANQAAFESSVQGRIAERNRLLGGLAGETAQAGQVFPLQSQATQLRGTAAINAAAEQEQARLQAESTKNLALIKDLLQEGISYESQIIRALFDRNRNLEGQARELRNAAR